MHTVLALQPIWRTSWLARRYRRNGKKTKIGIFRISRIRIGRRICSNFDGRFDRQGIQEYTLNTRRDGFKRVLLDWKKKKKKEENERIPDELINRTSWWFAVANEKLSG